MPIGYQLASEVTQILKEQWIVEKTEGVPEPDQLRLSNHAKELETATVLYADLDASKGMADKHQWSFSAEIYKAYLCCAARIIAEENGVVTACDGDRIMAVFTCASKNTCAVRAAMKINYVIEKIIQPAIAEQYPNTTFTLQHVIGIDTSQLRTTRIGVGGDNDLLWIGPAAHYAAKLTNLSDKPRWITKAVYDVIHKDVKQSSDGFEIWEKRIWTPMSNMEIYCSTGRYAV